MVIINQGYKGQVMDVYNINNSKDKKTLYNELILANPEEITLISIENIIKYIKIKRSDENNYNKILDSLIKTKNTLAKKFIYINYMFGTKKENFNNELNGYKTLIKIFKNKIEEHTTIKEGFKYNKKKIYGIIFNDDYYIFLEKCYKNLEEIKFTTSTLNKCAREIIETLDILNGNNYIHNDLKPNNIILCKNRFKIIDWENSNEIKNQSNSFTRNGNIVFNHPLKFYKIGIPYFIYDYIYDIDFINYKYLNNKNKPEEIKNKLDETINNVIEKYENLKNKRVINNKNNENSENKKNKIKTRSYNEIDENRYYFLKLYDYYSFALTIIYLAELNKIKYNKSLINPILKKFFIK